MRATAGMPCPYASALTTAISPTSGLTRARSAAMLDPIAPRSTTASARTAAECVAGADALAGRSITRRSHHTCSGAPATPGRPGSPLGGESHQQRLFRVENRHAQTHPGQGGTYEQLTVGGRPGRCRAMARRRRPGRFEKLNAVGSSARSPENSTGTGASNRLIDSCATVNTACRRSSETTPYTAADGSGWSTVHQLPGVQQRPQLLIERDGRGQPGPILRSRRRDVPFDPEVTEQCGRDPERQVVGRATSCAIAADRHDSP